jgi:hypothetical protein
VVKFPAQNNILSSAVVHPAVTGRAIDTEGLGLHSCHAQPDAAELYANRTTTKEIVSAISGGNAILAKADRLNMLLSSFELATRA